MKKTSHFTVTGRVQGVFFRARTRHTAQQLGLTGWVRNLEDGRVEGVASGSPGELEQFHAWLHQGPEHARVESVEIEELECQEFPDFKVR